MRKSVLFIVMLAGLALSGCNKMGAPDNTESSETYRGVVIKNTCCQIAIQVLGNKNLGESWLDGTDPVTPVYHNSFKVSNPCDFGNHVKGDTINFKTIALKEQKCTCCALYTSTPSTNYPIKVVN